MTTIDAGKDAVETLIRKIAREASPPIAVSSFVWWSSGEGETAESRLPLRIYNGNSWRSMDFLTADVEGSAAAPGLLSKYEGDIAQILTEL
jgi:hypothetical protein